MHPLFHDFFRGKVVARVFTVGAGIEYFVTAITKSLIWAQSVNGLTRVPRALRHCAITRDWMVHSPV